MTAMNRIGGMEKTEPSVNFAELIADIRAMKQKLKENGQEPNTLQINPAMLEESRRSAFLAECARLGLKVCWIKDGKVIAV